MAQAATVLSENELWDKLGWTDFEARKRAIAAGDEWHPAGFPPSHELYRQTAVAPNPALKPKPKAASITQADWEKLSNQDALMRSRMEEQGKPWTPDAGLYTDPAFRARVVLVAKKK